VTSKKRYRDHAKKREPGGYVPLPHLVLRSPQFAELSPRATKLLCDLLAQYRGDNNGDLCAAPSLMKARTWKSKAGIAGALAELEEQRFIVRTRQGGRHKATLYAVTFYEIDWCSGRLDVEAPSRAFMGAWHNAKAGARGDLPSPPVGQFRDDYPTSGAKSTSAELNCPTGRPYQAISGETIAPPVGTFIEVPLRTNAGQGARGATVRRNEQPRRVRRNPTKPDTARRTEGNGQQAEAYLELHDGQLEHMNDYPVGGGHLAAARACVRDYPSRIARANVMNILIRIGDEQIRFTPNELAQ